MRKLVFSLLGAVLAAGAFWKPALEPLVGVPILVYHHFGTTVTDSMTVTTPVFASQLKRIRDGGYKVIALRELVAYLRGQGPAPAPRTVVITVDDGHRTIYTDMAPLVKSYSVPVTMFIYPSAISNAKWALTWPQIKELHATGLFEVESHTYWHPNFRIEQKRLDRQAYEKFVDWQMRRSKEVLEQRTSARVELLAWPFGIYDRWLMSAAQGAGYTAGFTLERRPVTVSDPIMSLPRYLVTDADRGAAFDRILGSGR